jgi:DNA-binding transcriptional MerR regulator
MTEIKIETVTLPPIPAKRYFTIGEVSELCGVKPHVLRYWEQEFSQLKPVKRRGNRRYYQHHEVLLIRRIRELLYEQGFTINGARNKLGSAAGRIQETDEVVETPVDLHYIRDELRSILNLLTPKHLSEYQGQDFLIICIPDCTQSYYGRFSLSFCRFQFNFLFCF